MSVRDNSAYKKAYGVWAGRPSGAPPDFDRCCKQVFPSERGGMHHQCSNKRGFGPGEAYCKTHDPERVAAKDAARREKWAAQSWAMNRKWVLEKLGRDAIAALREIAAGHNDARGLAQDTLRDFDAAYPEVSAPIETNTINEGEVE